MFLQVLHRLFRIRSCLIQFIDKYQRRQLVALQKFPQLQRVPCHAIRGTDQQKRHIRDCKRPLRLCREVYMAWCIQQGDILVTNLQACHLGKDSDPSFSLQFMRVQKGILVIHPAGSAYGAGQVQKTLRQGCLPCIHCSKNGKIDTAAFHCFLPSGPTCFPDMNLIVAQTRILRNRQENTLQIPQK